MLYGRRQLYCSYENIVHIVDIVHIVHSYKDIAEDVEKRFNTSYYDVDDADRPLPMGNNKKVIGVMKDELGDKS